MYCTYCGANLPDDIRYCPFCGASLEKENISSKDYSQDNIFPETPIEHEIVMKQSLEEIIYDYFKANKKSAFTAPAIYNRLNQSPPFSDQYFSINAIEAELYKMTQKGLLNVESHNNKNYYIFNPRVPSTIAQGSNIVQRYYKPPKSSRFDSRYRKSRGIDAGKLSLIILGLVGLGFFLGGLALLLTQGFNSIALTFLVIGIILLIIVFGIITKGECFCDCCDC